jgi:hypothetical protein
MRPILLLIAYDFLKTLQATVVMPGLIPVLRKMFHYCLDILQHASPDSTPDLSEYEEVICRCELLRNILPKKDYFLKDVWEKGSVSIPKEDQQLLTDYFTRNGEWDAPYVKRYRIWNEDSNESMQIKISEEEFRVVEIRNFRPS